MNEDAADTNGGSGMDHALGTVAEQGAAEATASMTVMDGKPPKHDDRDRFGHVAAEAARCRCRFDAPGGERVIADDLGGLTSHEGARCTGGLILRGAALQPIIKGRDTGSEITDLVPVR